jgi:hypothetical protein
MDEEIISAGKEALKLLEERFGQPERLIPELIRPTATWCRALE